MTLGQAGRCHVERTGWNLPGGPQRPRGNPSPQASPAAGRPQGCEHRPLRWPLSSWKPDARARGSLSAGCSRSKAESPSEHWMSKQMHLLPEVPRDGHQGGGLPHMVLDSAFPPEPQATLTRWATRPGCREGAAVSHQRQPGLESDGGDPGDLGVGGCSPVSCPERLPCAPPGPVLRLALWSRILGIIGL